MSGPQCCSNPPLLNPNAGAGHLEKLAGLHSYVAGSSNSNLTVILISDVFGYEAPNLRKIADKVAAAGYYVVVPDFFFGDPYNPENAADRPLPVWLKDHGSDKGFEAAKSIVEALKSKGVSAIGAAGFCWGGLHDQVGNQTQGTLLLNPTAKVVVELAKSRLIQADVLLHPSFVSVDDIKDVDIPTAILGAETDKMSPPELVKQFEQVLAAKPGVDYFVKIFPKVSHGWTVRYKNEDPIAVKAAEEAHQDLLNWFAKHLK
ncbi:hypothetical protein V8G54_016613 [Vigna mungo]|uniref:Dienelactone hydrolase domain-containing protein n=1 Tax=Vigna mungo TaxID=3915 RepID=A0AAQ3NPD8_VIGMU